MRIVVAPDSFKGTLSARAAAEAIARGWSAVRPGDELVLRPMADGGEGTLDAFEAAVPGARRRPLTVTGPDGAPVETHWLLLPPAPGATAGVGVVELAATSGIGLMHPLDALRADTIGFGQAIVAALAAGVSGLLLGIGGSASTDGGSGALTAMGARFVDASGHPVPPGGGALAAIARAELGGLPPLPPGGATVLGDVRNPLLGPRGAAAVFGPQKGADAASVRLLDDGLAAFARAVLDAFGRAAGSSASRPAEDPAFALRVSAPDPATPGMGAAGGTAFGLAAWGARIAPGAAAVAAAIGLAEAIADAELVITGEGRYDTQSAEGKAPEHVAELAASAGVPVALVAGGIDADAGRFATSISLTELAGGGVAALADPVRWAEAAGRVLAGAIA